MKSNYKKIEQLLEEVVDLFHESRLAEDKDFSQDLYSSFESELLDALEHVDFIDCLGDFEYSLDYENRVCLDDFYFDTNELVQQLPLKEILDKCVKSSLELQENKTTIGDLKALQELKDKMDKNRK